MLRKIYTYSYHCSYCQKEFIGNYHALYCSQECQKAGRRAKTKGVANTPRRGTTIECEVCGTAFYSHPGRAQTSKYCSQKCYLQGRWGESHKVTIHCVICDTPFEEYASAKGKVCNSICKKELVSRRHRGEKSNLWRGGKTAPYNGIWRAQRRAVRERDGHKCMLCGSTDRLQVHHIIPYRYSQSHELDNLILLCRSCHSREELKVNPYYVELLRQSHV